MKVLWTCKILEQSQRARFKNFRNIFKLNVKKTLYLLRGVLAFRWSLKILKIEENLINDLDLHIREELCDESEYFCVYMLEDCLIMMGVIWKPLYLRMWSLKMFWKRSLDIQFSMFNFNELIFLYLNNMSMRMRMSMSSNANW